MATIQDTYNAAPAKGYAGMVANMEPSNRISRTVEDEDGAAFGAPVWRGAGDEGCTVVVGTAAAFLGFVIADHGQPVLPGNDADVIPQYNSAGILAKGAIYVPVVGAVDAGDAITVGTGADADDGLGATAANATHIATGFVADETVTDGLCRVVRR